MTRLPITNDDIGCRLDRLVRKRLKLSSLAHIYRLIRTGELRVNGRKAAQNYRLQAGDAIEVNVDPAMLVTSDLSQRDSIKKLVNTTFFTRNFNIIFEDESLIACDKPAGLAVHPGTAHQHHDTLIELAQSYMLSKSKNAAEPVLAHRLDKDTSGVILVAKSRRVVRVLHSSFASRNIDKRYVAMCHGAPPELKGNVELDLKRVHQRHKGTKMQVAGCGKASRSSYEVMQTSHGISCVAIRLYTGRTHQIRIHLQHLGAPIIGDDRYGDLKRDARVMQHRNSCRRLYLHAASLRLPHPETGAPIELTAPLPVEFDDLLTHT
ncbi:MAG: RluA family pseudouridine synthase [Chitinivibrionales bacterium]|nr:RluA family pseudouridine synthase [Chitinivibrionales bacterium]